MKKLLLLLLCLFSLNIITYASFPITENSSSDISNAISFQMAEEEDPDSETEETLNQIITVAILGFGAYFLIRALWRGWRDDIRWVKILTYILLAFASLLLLFSLVALIFLPEGIGFSGG
tara:strand:+ start:114 stop:473 length:360 start_codon:yes stop_codon:yes gene_type:complete